MKQEYTIQLDDCYLELVKIKTRINKNIFDEMVSYLQKYSIIKACGTIEQVFKNMLSDYLEQDANEEICVYIDKNIRESSANPKTGNISSILNDFSPKWKNEFDNYLKVENQKKQSLNSLVQLRNDFAHGRNPNSSISTIIDYYADARLIIEKVSDIIST